MPSFKFNTQNTTVYTITFNEEFVKAAKDCTYLEFYFAIYDDGWGITLTANGTTENLSGNWTGKMFRFATDGWDGTMKLSAKNAWDEIAHSSGYNVHIYEVKGVTVK